MKLTSKYNRTTLLIAVIVIITAGIAYYLSISYILTDQVNHLLTGEEKEIFEYVQANQKLPEVYDSDVQRIVLTPVGEHHITRRYADTPFFNKKENSYESGRALISSIRAKGQNYKIQILESRVETDDLIEAIFGITIGMILALIFVLYVTNRVVLRRLWRPFYNILAKIHLFNLRDAPEIEIVPTEIDEFRQLNEAVSTMSLKVKNDYENLKAFTDNAAHELFTPIAIINSKLDTLIQQTELSEKQGKLVSDIYHTCGRLTRLNKSLLLLVKVENKLVKDEQQINMKEMITSMVDQFDELFRDKNLRVNCQAEDLTLFTSFYMMEILVNNLLTNAIRHNRVGGLINIRLTRNGLMVQNTGEGEALDSEHIFKRFNKSAESEGSGLGLTISQQICQNMGFNLTYKFIPPLHSFNVAFNRA